MSAKTSTTKTSTPAKTTSTVGKNVSSVPTKIVQSVVGTTADGKYGPQTTAAVKAFQTANGLTADGIVGPKTSAAILAAQNKTATTVSGGGSGGGTPNTPPPSTPGGSPNTSAPKDKSLLGDFGKSFGFNKFDFPKTIGNAVGAGLEGLWNMSGLVPKAPAEVPFTPKIKTTAVGTSDATNEIDKAKKVVTTIDEQKKAQEEKKSNLDASTPDTSPTLLGSGAPNPAYVPPTVPEAPKPTTAEDKLADLPSEGNQWAYDVYTGERKEVPDGKLPAGYSLQNPKERTDVSDSITDENSTTFKKFSDGSVGRFDKYGNYVASSEAEFNSAKRIQDLNKTLDNARNGIFDPNQQAQLDGVKDVYTDLINKQTEANKAAEQGQIALGFMSGIAGTSMAQGMVTNAIQNGLKAVASLNAKRDSALADLKSSFITEDSTALKEAWTMYNTTQKDTQDTIDKLHQYAILEQAKMDSKIAAKNQTDSIKYHVDIPDDATPQQARDIIKTSPIYAYELQTKGGYADPDVTDAQVKYYKTNGTLPSFSYGAVGHAERNAFWSAVGGNPSTIIDATSNKIALSAAQAAKSKMQVLKSGTEASLVNLKVSMDNAETEMAKYSRTGSPFLNKPVNWIANELAGNKNYAGLNQALSSVATEYAKIKNGASASIAGAPVTSVEEEKKLINAAMSNGQLNETFDVIKKDSNGRMLGFNQALDSVSNDIIDLQNTDFSSTSSTGSGTGGFAETW